MIRVRAALAMLAALLVAAPSPARAALEAHLYVDRIDNIGQLFVTDGNDHPSERSFSGEEPYWHVAILDVDMNTLTDFGEVVSHASIFSDLTCANWDSTSSLVLDRDFSRVIPGGQTAWFYIGVFDHDQFWTNNLPGTLLAESLGEHHVSGHHEALVTPEANNGASDWHLPGEGGSWCGVQPTGTGQPAGNWNIEFRTYYLDTTPPTSASAPVHDDESAPAGQNDDALLTFAWTPGADPDSGVSQRIRIERQQDAAWCEVDLGSGGAADFDFQGTLACAAGSIASLTLAEGEAYRARVLTRNGVLPIVENAATLDGPDSAWVTQNAASPSAVPALAPPGSLLLVVSLGASAVFFARRLRSVRKKTVARQSRAE